MKKIIFSLTLAMTFSNAFAGTFSSLNLAKLASPEGRAEYYVAKYNPQTVNWGKEINQLKNRKEWCGPAYLTVGRQDALKVLNDHYQEYKLAATLGKLISQGKVVQAITGQDGSEGESESCSTADIKFYSIDGEVLTLSFDFNT